MTDAELECLECGDFFKHLGSHVAQKHKMTARQYKIDHGLDVKKGLVTESVRAKQRRHVMTNGTLRNLELGAIYRFKPGDHTIGRYQRSEQTLDRLSHKPPTSIETRKKQSEIRKRWWENRRKRLQTVQSMIRSKHNH